MKLGLSLALLLAVSVGPLGATAVTVDFGTPGAIGGTAVNNAELGSYVTFTSDSGAGLSITQIILTLGGTAFFDTATGAPGTNPFVVFALGTGPGGTIVGAPVADGATAVTINFTPGTFLSGMTQHLLFDLDGCPAGDPGCDANELLGSIMNYSITFGGPGHTTTQLGPANNSGTQNLDRDSAGGTTLYATGQLTGDIPASSVDIPEPSTFALLGGGLMALGMLTRRRRRQ